MSLRNNWSKLLLIMILIAIFSVQTLASSEIAIQIHSDPANTSSKAITNQEQKISSEQVIDEVSSPNYLHNLSMSDLLNYLSASYNKVPEIISCHILHILTAGFQQVTVWKNHFNSQNIILRYTIL